MWHVFSGLDSSSRGSCRHRHTLEYVVFWWSPQVCFIQFYSCLPLFSSFLKRFGFIDFDQTIRTSLSGSSFVFCSRYICLFLWISSDWLTVDLHLSQQRILKQLKPYFHMHSCKSKNEMVFEHKVSCENWSRLVRQAYRSDGWHSHLQGDFMSEISLWQKKMKENVIKVKHKKSYRGRVESSSCWQSHRCRRCQRAGLGQHQCRAVAGPEAAWGTPSNARSWPETGTSGWRMRWPGGLQLDTGLSYFPLGLLGKKELSTGVAEGWVKLVCTLTVDVVCVAVHVIQEVWWCYKQRGQACQQSSSPNVARSVDAAPKEADEDDEDCVSHLQTPSWLWLDGIEMSDLHS